MEAHAYTSHSILKASFASPKISKLRNYLGYYPKRALQDVMYMYGV